MVPGLAGGDPQVLSLPDVAHPEPLEPPSVTGPPRRLRMVRVRVPLLRAHRSAHGEERVRDVVLVEWTRPDGVVGWGECPTLGDEGYVTGSTERAWRVLVTELAPAALGGGVACWSQERWPRSGR